MICRLNNCRHICRQFSSTGSVLFFFLLPKGIFKNRLIYSTPFRTPLLAIFTQPGFVHTLAQTWRAANFPPASWKKNVFPTPLAGVCGLRCSPLGAAVLKKKKYLRRRGSNRKRVTRMPSRRQNHTLTHTNTLTYRRRRWSRLLIFLDPQYTCRGPAGVRTGGRFGLRFGASWRGRTSVFSVSLLLLLLGCPGCCPHRVPAVRTSDYRRVRVAFRAASQIPDAHVGREFSYRECVPTILPVPPCNEVCCVGKSQ